MTKKIKYLIVIGLIFIVGVFFYKAYIINKIDTGFNSINVENKRLIQMIEDNDYNIYDFVQIEEGMTLGGQSIKTLEAEKIYNKFLELKEQNITHKNYADYIMNVSLIQWFAGNGELAKDIIGLINLEDLNKEDKDKYYMIQAGYELTYNRVDKVIAYIELVENPIYVDVIEKIKEFLNVVYKEELEYKQTERLKGDNDIIIKIYSNIDSCNERARYRKKDGIISGDKVVSVNGRVTINGEPVSGAILYLESHSGISSFEGFES